MMTVGELKKLMKGIDDDYIVSICVDEPGAYMCPDGAVVDVERALRGADWHSHEFLIVPKYRLNIKNVDNWANRKPEEFL